MAPGGIFSHVDYKRDTAKLIPIGPNKGENTLSPKLLEMEAFSYEVPRSKLLYELMYHTQ